MNHTWTKTFAVLALVGWLGPVAHGQDAAPPAPPQPPPPLTPPAPPTPATDAGDWHADQHRENGGAGGWFAQGEYLLWRRDLPHRSLGIIADANLTDIDVRDLHFKFESGFRLQGGYIAENGVGFDAGFMAVERWQNTQTVAATATAGNIGNILSEFTLGLGATAVFPFDLAQSFGLSYSSRLYGGEVNGRYNLAGGSGTLSFLAGFRYLQINEAFALSAQGTATGAAVSPPIIGQYAASTHNNLYGAQIGSEAFINVGPAVRVQLTAKGGVFDNFMNQRTALTNAFLATGAAADVIGAASSDRVASVLEFGAFIHWWPIPNVGINIGYQGMFVTNVALAPQQLQFSVVPAAQNLLDSSGKIFYHGPAAGVEVRW